jgi:hypothetical protein
MRILTRIEVTEGTTVHPAGSVLDLPEAAAAQLLERGLAEPAAEQNAGEASSSSPAGGAGDTLPNTDGAGQAPPEAPAAGDEPAADAAVDVAEPAAPPARRRR